MIQLDLFDPPPSPPSSASPSTSIVGLRVWLPRPCPSCGNAVGVIGSSGRPHANRIDCIRCGSWRHWLSKSEAAFITAVSEKFGVPTTPIVLRGCV
jgi:hypothetical protein